jgi:hypothetical protein
VRDGQRLARPRWALEYPTKARRPASPPPVAKVHSMFSHPARPPRHRRGREPTNGITTPKHRLRRHR